jgi:hypothetical protein
MLHIIFWLLVIIGWFVFAIALHWWLAPHLICKRQGLRRRMNGS